MRLIDADALKKEIVKWLKPTGRPDETEMVKLDDIAISIFETIGEQPTAYDVEKVVELLKYKADVSIQHHFSVEHNVAIRTDDAIEIVRKGGINE